MRELGFNTIPQVSSHNAKLPDLMGSPEPSALQTRAIRGCQQQHHGRDRKQRPTGINTRTALLSLLAAAPLAMAQNCIPLTGSTQCSAFQTSSIAVEGQIVKFLYVLWSGMKHRS